MSRYLLKLSGEALSSQGKYDDAVILGIAKQVKELVGKGDQIGIVIGGGNYWRGRSNANDDVRRIKADQIGMLATVMNCIYVSEMFRSIGLPSKILTPFACSTFTELFSADLAISGMENGEVIFFAGGTGHPYFSTDTGVVLRAIEVGAEQIYMAKAIDGVYDSDPKIHPEAKKYDSITFDEIISGNLQVIDLTAAILARDNHMKMSVFDLTEENSILKAMSGDFNGTRIY